MTVGPRIQSSPGVLALVMVLLVMGSINLEGGEG